MHSDLWTKIQDFDFDKPLAEYGFSVRLAAENSWTSHFSQKAIEEYKKFMFLAAISNEMVSPSTIVDVVWHQHLIFTKSYHEFSELLGKRIDHIPSTHSRTQAKKFELARERTSQLYQDYFGEQPKSIWKHETMFGSLDFEAAPYQLRTITLVGIIAFITLIFPICYLLKPLFAKIDNPDFLLMYFGLAAFLFCVLEIHQRLSYRRIFNRWSRDSFVFELTPMELIYLKSGRTSGLIHSAVNNMFERNIFVFRDQAIHLDPSYIPQNQVEFSIVETYKNDEIVNYSTFLRKLIMKPVFTMVAGAMDSFKTQFLESKFFARLFTLYLSLLLLLILAGAVRWLTGITREKPVGYLTFTLVLIIFFSVRYLKRACRFFTERVVPGYYKSVIIPNLGEDQVKSWGFFLFGSTALMSTFRPLVNYVEKKTVGDNGGYTPACSSSDGGSGSSCGSCGGCGGGD